MSLIKSIKFVGSNLSLVNELMTEAQKHTGDLRVTIEPWSEKRTVSANAQQHVWYAKIAKKDGESVKAVELFCKRMFGLPVLMESSEYGNKITWTLNKLGFFNWPWEQQCNYMEMIPITSLMSTKQHNEFRDTMMSYYNKNGYHLDYMS